VGLSPEPPESPGLVKAASSRRTPNFRRQIETTVGLSPESPGVPPNSLLCGLHFTLLGAINNGTT
jgi:hypothetical protein